MDFAVLSRLESHSKDLFSLGKPKYLTMIREGTDDEELDEYKPKTNDVNQGHQDQRVIPPSTNDFDENDDETTSEDSKNQNLTDNNDNFDDQHYADMWGCMTRNMGKGFTLGFLGKAGINSLYPLLNLLRRRKVEISYEAITVGAQQYGLFFGGILSIYNSLMFLTRYKYEIGSFMERYRAFFAGGFAGTALLWIPKDHRWPIVLFTLIRALELQIKMLVKRRMLPDFDNGHTLFMCIASASMIHSFMCAPHTLDKSYLGFLNRHAQFPLEVKIAVSRMQQGLPIDVDRLNVIREKMTKGRAAKLVDPVGYDNLPGGEIMHPTTGLPLYIANFFARAMKLALPVYIPVFTIPVLMFYPMALVKKPLQTVSRITQGVLRSSVFLAAYCTFAIGSISLLRKLGLTYKNVGNFAHLVFAASGFSGGIATLLEKRSRRIELSLYVMSKALEGRWNHLVEKKLVPRIPNGEVLVFMWSMAVITHSFVRHKYMIRETYAELLNRFLDTEKRHKFYTLPRILSDQFVSLTAQPHHPKKVSLDRFLQQPSTPKHTKVSSNRNNKKNH